MSYRITKQYLRGSQMPCAEYDDLNEAKTFITKQLSADAALNVKVVYRIFKAFDLIEEFDPDKATVKSVASTQTTTSTQGATSTAGFRPTPFNVTPRPAGSPHNWLKDEEKK